jgi:GDP-L-fucose synthase
MDKKSKIYIAWHNWLVWSALVRKLKIEWYENLIYRTRQDLDLCDLGAVSSFFELENPEYVILCAAKVGWVTVHANQPFDVLYENLQIQNNVIGTANTHHVKWLVFLASWTIYPSECVQPIWESSLFQWELDPLHESNGLAKICWIKLCEKIKKQTGKDFLSLVPTNIYGIGDSFEEWKARVIGALISRFYQAKIDNLPEVIVWWTWSALREFLDADDLAEAILFFMVHPVNESYINIGTDQEYAIRDIAEKIQKIVGYEGRIIFDSTKPEGRLRRKLDTTLASSLGWTSSIQLEEWLKKTYQYFLTTL